MGYTTEKLIVTALLSRHNSARDVKDDSAWDAFRREVEKLAAKPRYRDIRLDVMSG